MSNCYLDMDSFYSAAYRLPSAPIVVNDEGVVISVPRGLVGVRKWLHVKDLPEVNCPIIPVTLRKRIEFGRMIREVYWYLKSCTMEARPFIVDGVLFKVDAEALPEIAHRVNEIAQLPFTIGTGVTYNDAIRACNSMKEIDVKRGTSDAVRSTLGDRKTHGVSLRI